MKYMSVDYGNARTGVAFSDKKGILASPYCVVEEKHYPTLVSALAEIAKKEDASKIIVGLPRNMDGSYGSRCDECRELGGDLKERTGIPVVYQDERLTTVMAHEFLSENNVRGKKRKSTVDAVSAVIILQSFLDSQNT